MKKIPWGGGSPESDALIHAKMKILIFKNGQFNAMRSIGVETQKKAKTKTNFTESKIRNETHLEIVNRFRMDLGARRMSFEQNFDIFGENVEIDHVGCGCSKGFGGPKALGATAKIVHLNIFSKNIKILFETHSSSP